jgi:hypothetical protein
MSDTFQEALQKRISVPIAVKWRRATSKWDLHQSDSAAIDGKTPFIPAAIQIECQESDLPLVRKQLKSLYPLQPRENRMTYPCGIRLSFAFAYNYGEFDRVPEESIATVRSLWHIQKYANMRIRSATINSILRHASKFQDQLYIKQPSGTLKECPSIKDTILAFTLPYKDNRGQSAPVFDSCELVQSPRGLVSEIWVTYRPQHAKYAFNALENMCLHVLNRSPHGSQAYIEKVFKKPHRMATSNKQWHEAHLMAYDQVYVQEGFSSQELADSLAEFSLDMEVVLQADAFKHMSKNVSKVDEGSAPHANTNDSQQLSALNSITTLRSDEESESSERFFRPQKPVDPELSYAAVTQSTAPLASTFSTKKEVKRGKRNSSKSSRLGSAVAVSQISSVSTMTSSAKNTRHASTKSSSSREEMDKLLASMRAEFDAELKRKLDDQAAYFYSMINPPSPASALPQSTTAHSDGGGQGP